MGVNCEGRDLATTLTIVGVILVAGVGLGIWRWWWCNNVSSEDSEDHETDSESDPEITETEDWAEADGNRQQRTVQVFPLDNNDSSTGDVIVGGYCSTHNVVGPKSAHQDCGDAWSVLPGVRIEPARGYAPYCIAIN